MSTETGSRIYQRGTKGGTRIRRICPFLLLMGCVALLSLSATAQITRTQIIDNGTPYLSFTWNADSCNLWSGTYCGGANIYHAPWVVAGANSAMPYCWGGWSTLTEFGDILSTCKSGGQVCSAAGGGCSGFPGAPLSCAGGHDCSGFVSRAWELAEKHSTSTLPSVSLPITSTSVQPGDVYNIAGSHVRLVFANNGSSITVMESSGADWKCAYHTYTPVQLSSYTPRCYYQVEGGCPVSCGNDDCANALTLYSHPDCINTLCSVDFATPDNFTVVPSCDDFSPPDSIEGAGVFFTFTPVMTADYTITVTPTGELDAVLVVYEGGCGVLQEVTCEDTPGGVGVITVLQANLAAGITYTIRVYDYGQWAPPIGMGGFNICITGPPSPPGPPQAKPATDIQQAGFTANWKTPSGADGYRLDVAADSNFTGYVPGYEDKDVGNAASHAVTGLTGNTTYYYRVRAYNLGGISGNSNAIMVSTAYLQLTGCPSVDLPSGEGSFVLSVDATMPWDAFQNAPWVFCLPAGGNGSTQVTVAYEANTSPDSRTCTILFLGGGLADTCIIKQKGQAGGMESHPTDGLTIYPNPAKDLLYIKTGNIDIKVLEARILDLGGRAVYSIEPTGGDGDTLEISLQSLSEGPYILQLCTSRGVFYKKVMINK